MRVPSCETAGATKRELATCKNDAGSLLTFARMARKWSVPPAPATSSVDSNPITRPSPLMVALR